MQNIILIGMPGAGKSTVGIVLAKILGYEFLDSDLLIQKQQGKLLHELITIYGTEGFLSIEGQVNSSIRVHDTVIATGGSAVYSESAMTALKENGLIVYLQLSYPSVKKRLGNLKKRGVVLRRGQSLYDLYQERCPLYEKYADITVNLDQLTLEESIEAIRQAIEAIERF